MFLSGVSMVRPMMSHDVRFYMKYSTVFSPVNTIIQTRIVLRVLSDNQKNFKDTKPRDRKSQKISLFPTQNWICAKTIALPLLMLKLYLFTTVNIFLWLVCHILKIKF